MHQCSNGEKEPERSVSNAEGVRRGAVGAEDRAPNARGVSMQLGDLGKRCKLPPPNDIWRIFGLEITCFIWQGSQGLL